MDLLLDMRYLLVVMHRVAAFLSDVVRLVDLVCNHVCNHA